MADIFSKRIRVLGTDGSDDDVQIAVDSNGKLQVEVDNELTVNPLLDIDITSVNRNNNGQITQIVLAYGSVIKTIDITRDSNGLLTSLSSTII